jgi:hypothetical protein
MPLPPGHIAAIKAGQAAMGGTLPSSRYDSHDKKG